MKNILGLLLLVGMSFSSVYAAELNLPIVRVFMHTPGDYSVMYMGTNNVVHAQRLGRLSGVTGEWIKMNHFSGWSGWSMSQTIVADVSVDKPMYVHLIGKGSSVYMVIHIHSPKEVSGGEWSTGGKYPVRGQTVVVE